MVPTNTGIFLRGLNLCGERRTLQVLVVSKKKIGVTMHFSEIIKLQYGIKLHTLLCFWIPIVLAKICLSRIVTNRAKIALY